MSPLPFPPPLSDGLVAAFHLTPGRNDRRLQSKLVCAHDCKQRAKNAPLSGATVYDENESLNSTYHEGIIGNAGASERLPKGRHGWFVLTVD